MDRSIEKLLGFLDDSKREYRFTDGEVSREEFTYCKILVDTLFGAGGLIESLGPTWHMVHDPRFLKIEACFVRPTRPVFGGDARKGKQTVTEDGVFTSVLADLEQYSEIIGEGRHFHKVVKEKGIDPKDFWRQSDGVLWDTIKQECPNYFFKNGMPNTMAAVLFNLFREDLLGLIDDYAEVALLDEWVKVDSLKLVNEDQMQHMDFSEEPLVYLEVDTLEKALSYRASLRATAAKILNSIGIASYLKTNDIELTDYERDRILQVVYESNWPDEKPELLNHLMFLLSGISAVPFHERQAAELKSFSERSKATVAGIKDGSIKQINHTNEGSVEVPAMPEELVMQSILNTPLKQELFFIWVAAEQRGDTKTFELLKPVFENPDYELTEDEYYRLLGEAGQRRNNPDLTVN